MVVVHFGLFLERIDEIPKVVDAASFLDVVQQLGLFAQGFDVEI